MTERERLTELICDASEKTYICEEIADYLIENGVIVPPCNVGDVVYALIEVEIQEERVIAIKREITKLNVGGEIIDNRIITDVNGWYFEQFGKTVFSSREEAEKALRERETEQCYNLKLN